MRTISASHLKANVLAILDQIAESGEGITVTRAGKAVVRILPAARRGVRGKGKAKPGDRRGARGVVVPVVTEEELAILRRQ